MRSSRVAKFRNNHKKILIVAQILTIFYAAVVSTSLLTGTQAYYSSKANEAITITTAEHWWDGSELFFPNKSTQNIKACAPIEISVELNNKGKDMQASTEFEVYYVKNGNPEKNGEKVGEGIIQPIAADETEIITFAAEEDGFYKFKVFQLEGFDDNYEKRVEIWSEMIHVNCNAAKNDLDDTDEKGTDQPNTEEPDEEKGKEEEEIEETPNNDSDESKDEKEEPKEEKKDKEKEKNLEDDTENGEETEEDESSGSGNNDLEDNGDGE